MTRAPRQVAARNDHPSRSTSSTSTTASASRATQHVLEVEEGTAQERRRVPAAFAAEQVRRWHLKEPFKGRRFRHDSWRPTQAGAVISQQPPWRRRKHGWRAGGRARAPPAGRRRPRPLRRRAKLCARRGEGRPARPPQIDFGGGQEFAPSAAPGANEEARRRSNPMALLMLSGTRSRAKASTSMVSRRWRAALRVRKKRRSETTSTAKPQVRTCVLDAPDRRAGGQAGHIEKIRDAEREPLPRPTSSRAARRTASWHP